MEAATRRRLLLLVLYLSFISLGLPDSILGAAWPELRLSFDQPLEAAGLLLSLTTLISVLSSFSSGLAVRRLGTGRLIAACAFMTAAAMFGYSAAPAWGLVIAFTLLFGVGQGGVDTAVNAYMARHYSARQMNWVHCCWGLGATGGPLILTVAFNLNLTWRGGYLAIGCLQLGLALVFTLALRLWANDPNRPARPNSADRHCPPCPAGPLEQPVPAEAGQAVTPEASGPALQGKRLFAASLSGILFYFLYPGIELVAGLWGASYLSGALGASSAQAAVSITAYWAALTAGRFITGLVAGRAANRNLIRGGLAIAACGAALAGLAPLAGCAGSWGLNGCRLGLVLLGLGLAPLYPTMMHDTPARLGLKAADRQVGFQVGAALAGAALIPAMVGLLARQTSLTVFAPVLLSFIGALLATHEISCRLALKAAPPSLADAAENLQQ